MKIFSFFYFFLVLMSSMAAQPHLLKYLVSLDLSHRLSQEEAWNPLSGLVGTNLRKKWSL